ncbi:hypothetical protein Hanom_Chr07g00633781 [Helianthus anomalus]
MKQLVIGGEENNSNISITKYRKLFGFLKQPSSPLGESHPSCCSIINLFNRYFFLNHHTSSFTNTIFGKFSLKIK